MNKTNRICKELGKHGKGDYSQEVYLLCLGVKATGKQPPTDPDRYLGCVIQLLEGWSGTKLGEAGRKEMAEKLGAHWRKP